MATEIVQHFESVIQQSPDVSVPVAAIKALLELIRRSKATTMSEFIETLKNASHILKESTMHPISVSAGCDLFMRFVTITSHDLTEFETCKEYLMKSGNLVVEKASSQKQKIVEYSQDFIRDGGNVLIHSFSRVVMQILIVAAEQHNKRFTVFATESRPSNTGYKAAEMLKRHGIPVNVILDSAVGYMIEKVDMVLVGAEGVVENGGLINTIGTYQLSVVAKNARKPFYAAAESFKFLRLFPLGQYDLPLYRPSTLSVLDSSRPSENGNESHPAIDYTPPEYITLLLTDLGVLTPSGVSDELIKLYYCYTDIFILHTFTAEYLRVSLEGSPVFSISAIANLQ